MKNSKPVQFVKAFLITLLITTAVSMATTYVILKINVDNKIERLEKTARLITGQIKSANLNSILAFTNDFTIFIIHERDGRILFESTKRVGEEKIVWEASRSSVIKEMMQKKEGQFNYPMIEGWQILSIQKIVRFLPLRDLGWIVAVELPSTVPFAQLIGIYTPIVVAILVLFSLCLSFLVMSFRVRDEEIEFETVDEKKEAVNQAVPNKLVEEAKKVLSNEENKVIQKSDAPVMPKAEKKTLPQEPENKEEVQNIEKNTNEKEVIDESNKEMKVKTKAKEGEKSHSEIYFDKMMEQKKKTKKPKPDTIIGMALTKKNNREKMD